MGKAPKKKENVGKILEAGKGRPESKHSSLRSSAAGVRSIVTAAIVAVITFAVFLPTLRNDFTNWDDDVYVYENHFIRSINSNFWKTAFFRFNASNWHPLTWISHSLDYLLWGLNPMGHHLTNNILHAVNTFLVVLLVVRLIEAANGSRVVIHVPRYTLIAAATTALLFGLHPLHVEAVAWISERKELLCAFFFFLSIIRYTEYVRVITAETARRDFVSRFFNRQYLYTVGLFMLALLSKPMAVSLPFVLLILDWHPLNRIRSLKTFGTAFVEKFPFFALSIVSSILTILAQKKGEALRSAEYAPMLTRVLVAAKSLITYLWKTILPRDLIPFYPYPRDISWLSPEYLFPVVLIISITIICVVIARKHKLWLAAWGYYVITLLPVIGIVQVGEQAMADRYTYLPSLGPLLIVALIASEIYEKRASMGTGRTMLKIVSVTISIVVLVSMTYSTIKQIGVWKNSVSLWTYVIEKEPGRVPLAHTNLGNIYASEGQSDRAMEQYQIALRLKPNFIEAHNNLGALYASNGQLDKAIEEYQTALRLMPNFAAAHNNLGVLYKYKGQLDRAMEEYQAALRLKPDFAEAHKNMGIAYMRKGLKDEAIREFNAALEISPGLTDVRDAIESMNR